MFFFVIITALKAIRQEAHNIGLELLMARMVIRLNPELLPWEHAKLYPLRDRRSKPPRLPNGVTDPRTRRRCLDVAEERRRGRMLDKPMPCMNATIADLESLRLSQGIKVEPTEDGGLDHAPKGGPNTLAMGIMPGQLIRFQYGAGYMDNIAEKTTGRPKKKTTPGAVSYAHCVK